MQGTLAYKVNEGQKNNNMKQHIPIFSKESYRREVYHKRKSISINF